MTTRNILQRITVLVTLLLLINLPLVTAVEISNVRAEDISDVSATIRWDTDEATDSFLRYGVTPDQLTTRGDAAPQTNHEFIVDGLSPQTDYVFAVESGDVTDDNGGQMHTFTTLPPDETAPELVVDIPESVKGDTIDIKGFTEIGAEVTLYVNGQQVGRTTATAQDLDAEGEDERVSISDDEVAEERDEEQVPVGAEEPEEAQEPDESEGSEVDNQETESEDSNENQALTGSASRQPPQDRPAGVFEFLRVQLLGNQGNVIKLEAVDAAGNGVAFEGPVTSDNAKPELVITIPELAMKKTLELQGNFSEEASFEVFVNNKSVKSGEGLALDETITLDDGKNNLTIVLEDAAGWRSENKFKLYADTKQPFVRFDFEKGEEYYQGRAVTSISGETKPGSSVYLYVFRKGAPNINFNRAWEKVVADENGDFTFKDVDLEKQPLTLEHLKPRTVPEGLQQIELVQVDQLREADEFTYSVYLITEDRSGRSKEAERTVNIRSCLSSNFAFDVNNIIQFQKPLRLDPQLVDDGRQIVTMVFNMSYQGSGVPRRDLATGYELEPAYKISNVQFEKACTRQTKRNDVSASGANPLELGCSILPQRPKKIHNADKSAWYLTYNLRSSRKKTDEDANFWNKFQKSQVIFPLKIRVTYQEREANGKYGDTKSQSSCIDMGYFIDVPLDSKDYLPDWLADEGLDSIQWTLDKIDPAIEYLETAILVTGIGCVSSFMGRLITRYSRLVTGKLEAAFSKAKPPEEQCPIIQHNLLQDSTIDHWTELESQGLFQAENLPKNIRADWKNKEKSLDTLCPMTAKMWSVEAALDQAYKWTCDRVFCRAVPAGWTSDKDKEQVDTAILAQNQCAITSQGVPLQEIENCQEMIEKNVGASSQPNPVYLQKKKAGAFTCYRNNDKLYLIDGAPKPSSTGEVVKLKLVHDFGLSLSQASQLTGATDLIAFKPRGADQFIVGKDTSCENACYNPRKPGYQPDLDGGIQNFPGKDSASEKSNGCYREYRDNVTQKIKLQGKNGEKVASNKYSAGYTSDCFVDLEDRGGSKVATRAKDGNTGMLQCVCAFDEDTEQVYGARTAAKEKDGTAENWIYRQDAVMKESFNRFGTYYPEWRYYGGRDRSSAFGANYATDYLRPDKEEYHEVNPHTQHIGAFQTVCLSGVRARLMTLRSILQGFSNCIEEAKVTGLRDAGVCKSVFSQHLCGLAYKAISYAFQDCSPYSMSDELKGSEVAGGISTVATASLGSIEEAMTSSITDIKSDYGNAQMNSFFATGAQGFAQSMCMAAFGFDFPMGVDFIMDTANSFSTKSTAHVIPAERELVTFNPASGSAIYNYNIGALVLPGCKIRATDVYLKCIGQEDLGHPGVQCGAQGCDCLQATQLNSQFEGEKIRRLDRGRQTNMKQGEMVDLKIPSPQQVDSAFRYDHVVVELKLDPFEKADNCFDEGYRDGKFYAPIIDTSPPGEFICQVQPNGRYFCPEIQNMFGGESAAYLEDPFISCFDETTQAWVRCDTPNLYTKGEQIRVRTHVLSDGGKYCLRTNVLGLPGFQGQGLPRPIPENLAGTITPEISLGSVDEKLFTAAQQTTLVLNRTISDPSCEGSVQTVSTGVPAPQVGPLSFTFQKGGADSYTVTVPASVTGVDPPYSIRIASDRALMLNNNPTLTSAQVKAAVFNINGYKVKNLVGQPQGQSGRNICSYTTSQVGGVGHTANQRSFTVQSELLMPDSSGSCINANLPVRVSGFGKGQHSQQIQLLLNPIESQVTSRIHQAFQNHNYQFVEQNAKQIIDRKAADYEDATAIYYLIASMVMRGKQQWQIAYKNDICNYMMMFFNRKYVGLGQDAIPYPPEVTSRAEFKKMKEYLKQINGKLACPGVDSTKYG